jgi:hypothetical protein
MRITLALNSFALLCSYHYKICLTERTRVLSVELYERNKRDVSLRAWRIGVPSRIGNRECREAVFIDGLLSLDGIPIGIEGRGSAAKWEGREVIFTRGTQRAVKKLCRYRIISTTYLSVFTLLGLWLQGWINVF